MYFFKTWKKPLSHLEFNCGARLTNCVSKCLCSGHGLAQLVERASHVLRPCGEPGFDSRPGPFVLHNAAMISINPTLLRKWYKYNQRTLASVVFCSLSSLDNVSYNSLHRANQSCLPHIACASFLDATVFI